MGLMMSEGKYVGRNEIAAVPTPEGTTSWKPVPHMDVIDAVTEVVKAKNWQILDEQCGLALKAAFFGGCELKYEDCASLPPPPPWQIFSFNKSTMMYQSLYLDVLNHF